MKFSSTASKLISSLLLLLGGIISVIILAEAGMKMEPTIADVIRILIGIVILLIFLSISHLWAS